ncbi:hypothetical protein D041_4285A, partial [Vibrio parahaemolyticus EKP-008]
MRTTS